MYHTFRASLACGLACVSGLLAPAAEGQQTPATVTLGDLVQTYNGAPKSPSLLTQPANLPVQVTYRSLSPTAPIPTSQVVYNDTPDPLALSYFSYGFAAQQLTALGNLVQLAGSARKLESCDVILVNYAKADDWPDLAAANPAGYVHPITITLYEVTSTNQLVFRTEATQNVLVPWRPLLNPLNGGPYPFSGYAFRATLPFANGITLPERVMVMVSFNTQASGFAPTGVPGPYNLLNVAQQTTANVAKVGSDVNPDVVLQVKSGVWGYPSTGWTGTSAPLVRLKALSTDSVTPPTDAGSWQASARISNADYLGTSTSNFTIQPAAASIQFGNLVQIFDGTPKSVTVLTNPPDLTVHTTYDGSDPVPSAPGRYAVHATLTNPNYLAPPVDAELWLGNNFNSWLNPWLQANQIPGTATGDKDDPDQDSIPNIIEYGLALDPSTANHGLPDLGLPKIEYADGRISLIYRKNLTATDLEFQVESSSVLSGTDPWSPAVTTDTVVDTGNSVQTIRASMDVAADDPKHFLRLRITRKDP